MSDGTAGEPYRIALRLDGAAPDVLDDVAVRGVSMFRAEMQDDGELWMACYFADDGEPLTFWVTAEGDRLTFRVTNQPAESDAFTYEPRQEHL